MDVTQSELERKMLRHGAQHLIHGHTHREGVHHFDLNGKPAVRTVLGAWHEHGSVLVCEEGAREGRLMVLPFT
jgi:UDP-2,3-diacylglucosamine hydrolase